MTHLQLSTQTESDLLVEPEWVIYSKRGGVTTFIARDGQTLTASKMEAKRFPSFIAARKCALTVFYDLWSWHIGEANLILSDLETCVKGVAQ